MINLLPEDDKKQIRAARANVILLRYNLLLILAFIFLTAVIGVAHVYLTTTRGLAEETIKENAEKENSYVDTKAKADDFRSQLTDAKTILDGQTNYAKAALNIAKLLPKGTALNELKLNEQSFSAPMALTVKITGEEAARQLINNFEGSPYFSQVTKGKIDIGSGEYPYTMQLTVTMSKEAAQ